MKPLGPTSEERKRLLGEAIFSPGDMTDLAMRYAEMARKQEGLKWGMERLDKIVTPLLPGHVWTMLGRPGNCKSTMLGWWGRRAASLCKEGEIVVHLTHEQAVEQADFMYWATPEFTTTDLTRGRVPQEVLLSLSRERARLPVWVMGESLFLKSEGRLRLTPTATYEALHMIEKHYDVKIKLLLMDYLQIAPIEKSRLSRVEQVTEAIIGTKEVGVALNCPVMQAAQAARSADAGGAEQIPALNEAQWASAIEQASDEVYGQWLVKTTRLGKGFHWRGRDHFTQPWHFLMRCLKDRWGGGTGKTWLLHMEPEKLILTDTEETDDAGE